MVNELVIRKVVLGICIKYLEIIYKLIELKGDKEKIEMTFKVLCKTYLGLVCKIMVSKLPIILKWVICYKS